MSTTAQIYAPYLGLALVILFAVDRFTPWDQALVAASILTIAFSLVLVVAAATLRITEWDISRTAERGLDAHDVFTTALEFNDPDDEVHQQIQTRANIVAAAASASDAVPITPNPRRLRQFGYAAALALIIGLLPPLGSSPAVSSDLAAALDAEAEEVERLAETVAEADVENSQELVEELERLAQELRAARTLEEAHQSLDDTNSRLEAKLDPQYLAQKAAVQGLATDLSLRPLVSDAPLDAASQFDQLADVLSELSEPERRALADRLSDLAASQAAGNPSLSSQLSEAVAALSAGDLAGAERALRQSARHQGAGVASARGQAAIGETQRSLDAVAARLSGEGQPGQGGQGEGAGAGGEGQRQDGAEGRSGGQGGSPQGGGASGSISGVAPGKGGASGQGGQGSVGTGGKGEFGTEVETNSVFSPIDRGEVSDLLQVGIEGGSGQGDVIGRADGPTQRGDSIVPYAQVLPEYLNAAADALAALQLPPSMRGIVQNYFGQLADEAR